MTRLRFLISVSLVIAAASGCGRSSGTDAGPAAAAPEARSDAHILAGGIVPPALPAAAAPQGAATDAAAGGTLFATMNCDACHGGGATGLVGPSLIDGRWSYGGADEDIFASIYSGRPKGMPAYGGVIGADGVRMLVAYLKALPVPAIVPTTSYEAMDRASAAATPTPPDLSARPASTDAGTPEQMLTRYGCIACHAVDRKVVGPSLRDVAAKYKGNADAERTLADKVKNGGAGTWGTIPMVPNTHVPERDLQALMTWMLKLE